MATLLQAEHLSRTLPTGRSLLDRVSIGIETGDRIALEGPAGSGKTLLLRALAQLDPVSSGSLSWRGAPVADADMPRYRSQVTYLPQTPALTEGTVETNLRLPFSLEIFSERAYDSARSVELLSVFGRDRTFLTQPIHALSGGERQIVALVRLLQLNSRILLLDEPTAALDGDTRLGAQESIKRWAAADEGRAYLWVTHDQRQADSVADRRLHMMGGRLV